MNVNMRCAALLVCFACAVQAAPPPATGPSAIFARSNLVAWCIVPYDGGHRTPEQRAAMLEHIGLHHYAYDWRAPQLPTFGQELDTIERHHIELDGVWFPDELNKDARVLLDGIAQHHLKTALWVTTNRDLGPDDAHRLDAAVARMRPIANEAAKLGCTLGLYNHGGWFGEPENLITIAERLKAEGLTNVGIVYNLHHAHAAIDRFATVLPKLMPYLLCLNLNGMSKGADQRGEMILPIGQGDLDVQLLRTIRDSGYRGLIGVLNHTDEDAEGRLLDNVEGIEWILPQLDGKPPTMKPTCRTWLPPVKRSEVGG